MSDIFVILTCLWMFITFVAYGGASLINYSAISTIEIFGSYLIGRCLIRSEAQFMKMMRLFRWFLILLIPGAIMESLTGFRLYNTIFSFLPTLPWANYERRLGMFRAQTVFEHPILYGVLVAFLFAPLYCSARTRMGTLRALIYASPSLIATFFSLSAGAFLGINVQIGLLIWEFVLRKLEWKWKLLGGLVVLAYIVVDLISNRTPFAVFTTYFTFDGGTAFWRILIFEYGIQNVLAHPIMGLGLGDWERPYWMYSSSVDNFWLVFAMRHGIPGFVLITLAYLAVITTLARARPASPAARSIRNGLAFSLIGVGIALCTVHLWGATLSFLMLMMGSGAWISDAPQDKLRRAGNLT